MSHTIADRRLWFVCIQLFYQSFYELTLQLNNTNSLCQVPDNGPGLDKPGGPQMSTLPSFSFSVRPPSEEQTRSEDTGGQSCRFSTIRLRKREGGGGGVREREGS